MRPDCGALRRGYPFLIMKQSITNIVLGSAFVAAVTYGVINSVGCSDNNDNINVTTGTGGSGGHAGSSARGGAGGEGGSAGEGGGGGSAGAGGSAGHGGSVGHGGTGGHTPTIGGAGHPGGY
jgi:hypothetical protein